LSQRIDVWLCVIDANAARGNDQSFHLHGEEIFALHNARRLARLDETLVPTGCCNDRRCPVSSNPERVGPFQHNRCGAVYIGVYGVLGVPPHSTKVNHGPPGEVAFANGFADAKDIVEDIFETVWVE
jgi:hypothetical protein